MQGRRVVDRLGGQPMLVEVGCMHAKWQERLVEKVGALSYLTLANKRHVGIVIQP